jgi:hypothetical protein
MLLERIFKKNKETKTAKSWMNALEARQVQKNSYLATGDLKLSREFASVMSQEVTVQAQVREVTVKPVEIFSYTAHRNFAPAY